MRLRRLSDVGAAGSVTIPGDTYYSQVSLLLHADGNGTAFIDSSPSPKTITANGDATQSSTQSKFGGKSLYLDGTGDYLSVPNSAAFDFGSDDFTIEAWIYIAANAQTDPDGNRGATIGNCWNSGDPTISGWNFGVNGDASTTGTGLSLSSWNAGNGTVFLATAAITQSAWHHVAASVSGGTRRLYLDGALITNTTTITVGSGYTPVNSQGNALRIGNTQNVAYPLPLNGYIDEFRITKGASRGHTGSTIAVPTAPFPDTTTERVLAVVFT